MMVNVAVLEPEANVPVIVAEVDVVTAFVLTLNVAVDDPTATDTDAGTVADEVEDFSVTLIAPPELPGVAFRVTVPVEDAPPTTEEGDTEKPVIVNGKTVREVLSEVPLNDAFIVVEVDELTTLWVMVKVAVVAPAATVTDAGAVAALVEELVSVTTLPPDAAALLSLTVPVIVTLQPPTTDDAERFTLLTVGAVIVSDAVAELDPIEAVLVAEAFAETAVVVIVNVAVLAPEATVTDAGTVAEELLDFRLTTVPPDGAAAEIVTVPVLDTPPATLVGLTVTEPTVTVTAGLTVRAAV